MSEHPVIMPKLGQAMEYGTIAEWIAADGTPVRAGQPIASVESDKATFEIEATETGVIRHLARVGDEVAVGQPFAAIGEAAGHATGGAYAIPADTAAPAPSQAAAAASPASGVARAPAGARALASPRAKALAHSLNVEIAQVAPHRADGLIVAADVEAAAQARKAAGPAAAPAAASGEGVALTRLQKVAADRLARSWSQAPHIVQMIEVDAEQLADTAAVLRDRRTATLNDLLIKAAADCLSRYPALNARFAGDRLVPLGDVSVGLAVATEAGLTVPVVRGADRRSLAEVAGETRELIAAARAGRLGGTQVGGASVTISNLGAYGIAFGTPVLNLDEPILIFVGAIEERPVVRGGQVVVGRCTTLSIAYDHRVVDGLAAARFSQALKKRLETAAELLGDAAPAAAPAAAGPPLGHRELQASSPAGRLRVDLRSERHAWTLDEPAAVGGEDAGPDPVTMVLGALASCMSIAFKLAASRRNVPVGEVRAHVRGNPAGKLKEAHIRLEVWSPAPDADVRKLLPAAKASCFVHDMLRPDLPVEIELAVHPTPG